MRTKSADYQFRRIRSGQGHVYKQLLIMLGVAMLLLVGVNATEVWHKTAQTSRLNAVFSREDDTTAPTKGLPTPTPNEYPADWRLYKNSEFGFEISYPGYLIASVGDGAVGPGVGPDYVSGTPAFWFGTISANDVESSPGKLDYSALIIMPTQCFKGYWGNSTTTDVEINGISMESQALSPALKWFTFAGDLKYGWSSDCNTILIGLDSASASVESVYGEMLETFRFVSG